MTSLVLEILVGSEDFDPNCEKKRKQGIVYPQGVDLVPPK
jgi:hypothetical protein